MTTNDNTGAIVNELEHRGFTVTIRSDETFFTVRDAFGEPCGTIQRPSRLYGNTNWLAHAPNGKALMLTGVGPRQCLRSIAVYHGA